MRRHRQTLSHTAVSVGKVSFSENSWKLRSVEEEHAMHEATVGSNQIKSGRNGQAVLEVRRYAKQSEVAEVRCRCRTRHR